MRLAEKEHKKYKKGTTPTKPRVTREEKVPEWFDKQIEKQEITEEEKKQLEEILKEYN